MLSNRFLVVCESAAAAVLCPVELAPDSFIEPNNSTSKLPVLLLYFCALSDKTVATKNM